MRLYLICDNEDTAVGLRLAGIESTVVGSKEEVPVLLEKAAQDPEIGIVLINRTLASRCSEEIGAFRKSHSLPAVTEIPDRSSDGSGNSIADYVSEAIGIKI